VQLGVRHGSDLGPFLFVLYVNNITLSLKHSQINLLADDTLSSIAGSYVSNGIHKMNEDLISLSKFNVT
jgi:hypothetical protein